MAEVKRCSRCKAVLPLTEFYKDRSSSSGRESRCRTCAKAKAAAYRTANPEKAAAATKRWAQANSDRVNARNREWAAKNPDKKRASNSRYSAKHSDQVVARVKAWVLAHPDRARELRLAVTRRYRERLRALPSEAVDRFVVFERDDWTCQICDAQLDAETATIDHVIPVSNPASMHTYTNVQTLCMRCNSRKGARVS